jgi:hypothetical protein
MDWTKLATAMAIVVTQWPQMKADFDELIDEMKSDDGEALRAAYDAAMVDAEAAHRDAQSL